MDAEATFDIHWPIHVSIVPGDLGRLTTGTIIIEEPTKGPFLQIGAHRATWSPLKGFTAS